MPSPRPTRIAAMTGMTLGLMACGGGGGGDGSASTPPACLSGTPAGCNVLVGATAQVTSEPVTAATGGTVTVDNSESTVLAGTSITIPPGALPANTTITVGIVSQTSFPADVLVTDIGPTGTIFTNPATVGIKYRDEYVARVGAAETVDNLKVVVIDPGVAPQTLRPTSIDTVNNLVTADTPHLSYFTVQGYSKASLKGTYTITGLKHDFTTPQGVAPGVGLPLPSPRGFGASQAVVRFDGNGTLQVLSHSLSQDGVVTTTATGETFTYDVSPTGEVSILDGTVVETSGQVLAGGSLFVLSESLNGNLPETTVGMLQVQTTYNQASLNGIYTLGEVYFDQNRPQAPMPAAGTPLPAIKGRGSALFRTEFHGDGTYSHVAPDVINEDGVVTVGATLETGIYNVRADGAFCMDDNPPAPVNPADCTWFEGRILAGGAAISYSNLLTGDSSFFGMGIKEDTATFSNATVKGTYTILTASFDLATPWGTTPAAGTPLPTAKGFAGTLLTMVADGAGNYTLPTMTRNIDGVASTVPLGWTGTYTVNPTTGKVVVTGTTGSTATYEGQVSADGSTFVLVDTTNGEKPETMWGLLR